MEKTPQNAGPDVNLIWVGLLIEGGLTLAALGLATWGGVYDPRQPLASITLATWWRALTVGTIATVPLFLFLLIVFYRPPTFLQPMRAYVAEVLHPLFRGSTWGELVMLSLMAGFAEELFFRWCLQGGITRWLENPFGTPVATLIGLVVASSLFGLCHAVTRSYGIIATLAGLYLGGVMILSGTFLASAVCHAIYDLGALIAVVQMRPDVD